MTPEDDLLEVSGVYERSWKYAYKGIIPQDYLDSIPEGRWAKTVTREGMNSLIVTEGGRIIGTAGFCKSRWPQHPDHGEIVSLYLLPEYIGKGVGRQLTERCLGELQGMGFKDILLWVLEDNARARCFYEKAGFVCTGEYLNDNIGGKSLREVMYERKER